MQRDDAVDVDRRHDVAVEDDERVGDALRGEADRAAGAERRRLDDVADADAGAGAVAEDLLDAARLIVEAEDHLVDLGHLLEQIDLIVEKRAVENRHDGLGRVDGQRPQPRALAPCKENRFHVNRTILPNRRRLTANVCVASAIGDRSSPSNLGKMTASG